jgi:hypothetical protein
VSASPQEAKPQVIQKVGPDYEGDSPEKRQFAHLESLWNTIRATERNAIGVDPRDFNNARFNLLETIFPNIDARELVNIVANYQDQEFSKLWQFLVVGLAERNNKKRHELHNAVIGGRHSEWRIGTDLGHGSEGRVYLGSNKTGGKPAAIKIFRGETAAHQKAFEDEVKAHQLLRKFEQEGHPIPHVVRMLDYNTYVRSVIMELVPGHALDKLREGLESEREEPFGHLPDPVRKERIDPIVEQEAPEAYKNAVAETQGALRKQGYELADVQPRNTMYDHVNKRITFVDISLRPYG